MRAIIIAAGRGSRLRPYTDRNPKCLLEFAGRTLLDWQISALAANGINEVGIVKGYLAERLNDSRLESWTNPRWSETNMVYSLLCAREALLSRQRVVVSYGDIIYEPRVVTVLLGTPGQIVVAVDRNWRELWERRMTEPLADAESLSIADNGEIKDIGTKVTNIAEVEAQYMGLLSFDPVGAEHFVSFVEAADAEAPWLGGRDKEQCYMTDVLRGMIDAGHSITAAATTGGWLEFDTKDDLDTYSRLLRTRKLEPFFSPWPVADQW